MMHHSGFNPLSSHEDFELDYFWPEPMEHIKPCKDLFFLNYQKFKAKCIARISLKNMIENSILAKNMINPKDVLHDQHETKNQDKKTSHKRPRDNQFNLTKISKLKQIYKEKEKVVEQPPMVSSILPSQEKKPRVEHPDPTQKKLEN
jgi:hypothetical protein